MIRRAVLKAEKGTESRAEGRSGITAASIFAGLVFVSGIMAAVLAGTGWRIGADFQERTCIGRVFLFRKNDVLENLAASPEDFRNSLLAVELSRDWQGFRKGTLLLKEAGAVSGDLVRFSEKGLCLAAAGSETPGSAGCFRGFPRNGGGYFQTDSFRDDPPGSEPGRHSPARQRGLSVKPFAFPKTPSSLTAPGRIPWIPGFWGLFRCPGLRRSTGQCGFSSSHGCEGNGQSRETGKGSPGTASGISSSGFSIVFGNRPLRGFRNLRGKRMVPGLRHHT